MSRDRDWTALRALPAGVILAALGVERCGGGLVCPRCRGRLEVADGADYGVSVRCRSERCRLGSWNWPEWVLDDLSGSDLDEAARRLLEAGRAHARVLAEQANQERRVNRLAALMEIAANV
ncbi:hypothetical protein BH18GEM1_BH18GEM1_08230 [soil metagenome]